MILIDLELHNFGVYLDLHSVSLAPASDRPIILFGGLNGAGKTTLLEAILLALYGKRTFAAKREGLPYDAYLRRCIHHSVSPSDGASVRLRFAVRVAGELRTVRISRLWYQTSTGIKEVHEVHEGRSGRERLNRHLTERWDEHVEGVLPLGVAPLFIFDGDRIEGFADVANSGQLIQTAIHGLLGLDLVDRLAVDLEILERRKLARPPDRRDAGRLRLAENLLAQAESDLAAARQRVDRLARRADEAATRSREIRQQFKRDGGELYVQRQELQARHARYREAVSSLEDHLRETVAGLAPLLLVRPLLAEIHAHDAMEQQHRLSSALAPILNERDQATLDFVAVATDRDTTILDELADFLAVDRARRRQGIETGCLFDLAPQARAALGRLLDAELDTARDNIIEGLSELNVLRDQVNDTERTIRQIPAEDDISRLLRRLELAQSAQAECDSVLAKARDERDYAFRQCELAKRSLAKEKEAMIKSDLHDRTTQRVVRFSARARDKLGLFRDRVLLRNLSRIQQLVIESFQQLLRKDGLVHGLEIDHKSLTVRLFGASGQSIHPDRLSAGERHLLAVSLLWGLARASRRVIPTVVDTPLGRLDSFHRDRIVNRYFPYAGHQVILLSTDEEIVGRHFRALEPHVGRSYNLSYDDGQQASSIVPGYFSKELEQ